MNLTELYKKLDGEDFTIPFYSKNDFGQVQANNIVWTLEYSDFSGTINYICDDFEVDGTPYWVVGTPYWNIEEETNEDKKGFIPFSIRNENGDDIFDMEVTINSVKYIDYDQVIKQIEQALMAITLFLSN